MLHALAQGISRSGEPESIDEVILLCDLIIESNDNYNLLECYVSKLVTMNCNPQTSRIFDKLLTQANKGCKHRFHELILLYDISIPISNYRLHYSKRTNCVIDFPKGH